jgi:hypothetical protein
MTPLLAFGLGVGAALLARSAHDTLCALLDPRPAKSEPRVQPLVISVQPGESVRIRLADHFLDVAVMPKSSAPIPPHPTVL